MLLIKNGRVHIGNGEIIDNADILIEGKKIKYIGINLKAENCKIINAENMEVFPGFIDTHNTIGCKDRISRYKDNNEDTNPITPYADIKYSFSPYETKMEELYKVGITTICETPGNTNIIGGSMAAFKTWGLNSNTMLLRDKVGMKGSINYTVKNDFGSRHIAPQTRMAAIALLVKEFKTHDMSKDDIITKVLNREIPFFVTVETASEIEALVNALEEFNIKLVIVYAYQADRCIESIKKNGVSVVLADLTNSAKQMYNKTDLYKLSSITQTGSYVSFCLVNGWGPVGKTLYLWDALRFYKAGVPSEEVLKMMTYYPAKMLGIDDVVGTIEKNKDADIVIYSCNPIEYYTARDKYTIINGEIVYEDRGDTNAD